MTEQQLETACKTLWQHWQEGRRLRGLPEEIRPSTRAEGYAVQARLELLSAFPLYGWKIAATSKAGQAHIGVDGPLAGRLLRQTVCRSGSRVNLLDNHMCVAEAEFAFHMAADLPPRTQAYTVD